MAVRGYVKYRDDASSLYGAMHRLVEAGVGSDMISMEPDVLSVVGSLASGDSLVLCSLYDLANGLPSLMSLLGSVARRGARLSSLDEPWFRMSDTPCDWIALFEGFAAFGSRAVAVRTRQALSSAVEAGRKLGRPRGSLSAVQRQKYRRGLKLYKQGRSIAAIARELQISRGSFVKWLDRSYPELRTHRHGSHVSVSLGSSSVFVPLPSVSADSAARQEIVSGVSDSR